MANTRENIKVISRFRPLNQRELKDQQSDNFILNIDTKTNSIVIGKKSMTEKGHDETHQFIFDCVYGEDASQEYIFNTGIKNAVQWVIDGYNGTIFAYGPTGSGKTHTMFGGTKEQRGIIPRCSELLFEQINSKEDVIEAHIKCSFLEIYRENIRDLLNPLGSTSKIPGQITNLRIRESKQKGIYVQGLIEKFVYTPLEILQVIKEGTHQRAIASTSLNNTSSRSHAVLTLITTQILNDGTEIVSKLHLIDLAGSENVGRSEAQGTTLAEAQMINKSLSALGNVIYSLTEKNREHIPYRDSRLTYLLQNSLGGNSKTILITTSTQQELSYSETVNTLKFAQRAKLIKNIPIVNRNRSNADLRETIEKLQHELDSLQFKYDEAQEIINGINNGGDNMSFDNKNIIILQTRNKRLQYQVDALTRQLEDEKNKYLLDKEIFVKQRELAMMKASELCQERILTNYQRNLLEQYQLYYESLKEALNNNPNILKMMVEHANIEKKDLKIDVDVETFVPVDIDSPR